MEHYRVRQRCVNGTRCHSLLQASAILGTVSWKSTCAHRAGYAEHFHSTKSYHILVRNPDTACRRALIEHGLCPTVNGIV